MIVKKSKLQQKDNTTSSDQFRCMFCGGHQCKRCGPTAYLDCENCVLKELHSNWITNNILGMARPTNLNEELLQDFKEKGISAVFNLTMPGEHPFCGTKSGALETSGFSYDPEKLMGKGIKHFNYSWPDMTIPTVHQALQIVQIGLAEINQGGKIAVHCHAGYGRTGMVIACILIAKDGITAAETIPYIRSRRPGSVQTSSQVEFVHSFERYYAQLLNVYNTPEIYQAQNLVISPKSIIQCMHDQEHTIPAFERTALRWIHKSIDMTQQILQNCFSYYFESIFYAFTGFSFDDVIHRQLKQNDLEDSVLTSGKTDIDTAIYTMKVEANKNDWTAWESLLRRSKRNEEGIHVPQSPHDHQGVTNSLSKSEVALSELAAIENMPLFKEDTIVVAHLLLDWLDDRSEPLFSNDIIQLLAFNLNTISASALLSRQSPNRKFHDTNDFSFTVSALPAASTQKGIEEVLTKNTSKYEQHVLSRLCLLITSCNEYCTKLCQQNNSNDDMKKAYNSASDYITLRVAISCILGQKACPKLLNNRALSIEILSDVVKYQQEDNVDSFVFGHHFLTQLLIVRDTLNVLAAYQWMPPVTQQLRTPPPSSPKRVAITPPIRTVLNPSIENCLDDNTNFNGVVEDDDALRDEDVVTLDDISNNVALKVQD